MGISRSRDPQGFQHPLLSRCQPPVTHCSFCHRSLAALSLPPAAHCHCIVQCLYIFYAAIAVIPSLLVAPVPALLTCHCCLHIVASCLPWLIVTSSPLVMPLPLISLHLHLLFAGAFASPCTVASTCAAASCLPALLPFVFTQNALVYC
jgi:hypothetical protein